VAARGLIDHWRTHQHCEIDWQALVSIQAQAAELLAEELSAPAGEPLRLIFWGADHLLSGLAQATPQGQSQVPRGLWALRFCLLARMHLAAAYDKAATDFCLTYIAPAPPWWLSSLPFESDLQAPITADRARDSLEWQLQGHIVGVQGLDLPDLSGTLISQPVSINCAALLRMDPTAMAQWVRWLRSAKAKKVEIHLQNVGVLVGVAWVRAGVDHFGEIHPQELV
jgi:ABC-type transporter Mla MlaB component